MDDTHKWKDAMDVVGRLVNDFLTTRGDLVPKGRADVVFENLTAEGSGKGVCILRNLI